MIEAQWVWITGQAALIGGDQSRGRDQRGQFRGPSGRCCSFEAGSGREDRGRQRAEIIKRTWWPVDSRNKREKKELKLMQKLLTRKTP